MKRYQFYVGTADKNKLEQIKPDSEFIACFDFLFEDYTLQEARGHYTMQELSTVIEEKSFIVTVIDDYTDELLKWIVSNLKKMLNQESILVTIEQETQIKFL